MIFQIVSVYTVLHFLVDFSCAFLLYHQVYPVITNPLDVLYCFLIYNFFAFAVQLPIGMVADYVKKNALFALIGCLLVGVSFVCQPLGLFACIVAGLGNAFFHIGAGVDVLTLSKGKAALPGVFVSSGALGIFLGAQSVVNKNFMSMLFVILLGIGCIATYMLFKSYHSHLVNFKDKKYPFSWLTFFMICCLCLTVLLRSYTGFAFTFAWKNVFIAGLVFTLGVVLGKTLGGIISDKYGMKQTAILSLLLSAICFCFAFQDSILSIIAGTIGVLFFNMTMPITLTALTNLMPDKKGFAFGLLTFMLFLGALPFLFGHQYPYFSPKGLCVLILISAVVLYGGLNKRIKD